MDEPVQKNCWSVTLWAALALLLLGALANVATADPQAAVAADTMQAG